MNYSVGIGITDLCNLSCPHCYSRSADGPAFLSIETVKNMLESLDIKNINLGTGESGLHPGFLEIVTHIRSKRIDVGLTTNGHTVARLSDAELRLFHDIDFSLDFPSEAQNDWWRGQGSFKAVKEGIRRCQQFGVETSVACCMMNSNYKDMGRMVELCGQLGVNLRINVYKPVHSEAYSMTYVEFWEGIRLVLSNSKLISCSEPIVNALIGHKLPKSGGPCGQGSFRLKPTGEIVPCVYWTAPSLHVNNVLSKGSETLEIFLAAAHIRHLPETCTSCRLLDICGGGCAGRRVYRKLTEPDHYCFLSKQEIPDIKVKWDSKKDLVHSDYLCTIITTAD